MEFQCKKCDKSFDKAQGLRMHIVRTHTKHRKGAYTKNKMKNASKKLKLFKGSQIPPVERNFSKADLVAVIKVKIDSLKDVLQMLENL